MLNDMYTHTHTRTGTVMEVHSSHETAMGRGGTKKRDLLAFRQQYSVRV